MTASSSTAVRRLGPWVACLASIALILTGCDNDNRPSPDEPPSPDSVSVTITAAGGTVNGPDGVQIVIPPGAVDDSVTIRIARSDAGAPAGPGGYTWQGSVYEITPHDFVFLAPVTIRLPIADDPEAEDLRPFRASVGDDVWEPIEAVFADGYAEWPSLTFSWIVAAACSPRAGDPLPCVMPTVTPELTATPPGAVILESNSPLTKIWRITDNATLTVALTIRAPADCTQSQVPASLRIWQVSRSGPAQNVLVLDTSVTLGADPSPRHVRGTVNWSPGLSAEDNPGRSYLIAFRCTRAFDASPVGVGGMAYFMTQIPLTSPPTISTHPANTTVTAPGVATFTAVVSGTPSPTLQWQRSTDGGQTWSNINGATTATYTTPATSAGQSGYRFRVVAINGEGTASSDGAVLTVTTGLPPPAPFLATCPAAPNGYSEITRLDWTQGDSGLLRGLDLACSRGGSCMATWARLSSSGDQISLDGVYTARWTPGSGWSEITRHTNDRGEYPQIGLDDQGNAHLLWWRNSDGAVLNRRYLAGSGWTAVTPVSTPHDWGEEVDLQVAGDGRAVLAQVSSAGNSVLARRLHGGVWSAPVTVFSTEGTVRHVQVVLDKAGRATALWEVSGDVYAASADSDGNWGEPVALATSTASGYADGAPQLALSADGTAWGAWIWIVGEEYRVQTRRRPAGGEWTMPADSPVESQFLGELQLGAGPAGRLMAAYQGYSLVNGNYPAHVYAREYQTGQGWRPQVMLTSQAGQYGTIRLAMDAGGNATVVFRRPDSCCDGALLGRSYAAGLGWSELRTVREYDERFNEGPILVATGYGPAVLGLNERLSDWTGERLGTVACLEGIAGGNMPPLADAGRHQTVLFGTTVQLDGSASYDPENVGLTYAWTLASRPAGSDAELSDEASATPAFVADLPGLYEMQLVVNDGTEDSLPSTVTVLAIGLAIVDDGNKAPVANAGSARKVLVGSLVELYGDDSFDPDGDPLTYAWSIGAGPAGSAAIIGQPDQQRPSFVPDVAGIYRLDLVVGDGQLVSEPASVIIAALDAVGSRLDIVWQYPAPGATFVPPTLRITAGFSAPVDPASVNQDVFSVAGPDGPLTGLLYVQGAAIGFFPEQPLDPDVTYSVTALRQIAGLDGRVLGRDVVWHFFTGEASDVARPQVVRVKPADGATGVLPLKPGAIEAEFDEPMDPGSLVTGFQLAIAGGAAVPGYVQVVDGTRAVFVPQPAPGQSLSNQALVARLTTEVRDEAGNALERTFSWSFRTLPSHSPAWLSRPGLGSATETSAYYSALPIRNRCTWGYLTGWTCRAYGAPPTFNDWLWDLGWSPLAEPRAVFFNGDDLALGRNAKCFVSGAPDWPPGTPRPPLDQLEYSVGSISPNDLPGQVQVGCYVANHGPAPGSADHPNADAALADAIAEQDASSITAIFSRYSEPRTTHTVRIRENATYAGAYSAALQIGDIVTIGPATGTILPGNLFYSTSGPAGVGAPCTSNFIDPRPCPMEGEPLYGLLVDLPLVRLLDGDVFEGRRYMGDQALTFKILRPDFLEFRINDTAPGNVDPAVSGQYVVPIVVERANAVSFMVYAPDGTGAYRLTGTANLDSEGPKQVPHACIACHGGDWDPETRTVTGASLLPFDPARLTFPEIPGWRRADRERAINRLNNMVRITQANRPLLINPVTEWLAGTYGAAPWSLEAVANDHYVPPGWAADPTLYREVVKPYCQSCHQALRPSLDFSTAAQFRSHEASIRNAVCTARSMPHAEATFVGFWRSNAPQVLRQLLFNGAECP